MGKLAGIWDSMLPTFPIEIWNVEERLSVTSVEERKLENTNKRILWNHNQERNRTNWNTCLNLKTKSSS